MAIATLALCYNNGKVFEDMIKIRKGQAVQLIMQSNSSNSLQKIIAYYSKEVCTSKLSLIAVYSNMIIVPKHGRIIIILLTMIIPA